jgi:asparagine synthase (glutamine-hydrolysing)
MKGILPEEIRWRGGKATLTPNFNRALSMFGRETLDDVIVKNPGNLAAYVNLTSLRNTYQRYLSGSKNVTYDDMWSAVTLALWLRYREATDVGANGNVCAWKSDEEIMNVNGS